MIVKFVSRICKVEFIIECRKKKPLADIVGGSSSTKIYVNEHLTQATSKLLKYSKERLKPIGF